MTGAMWCLNGFTATEGGRSIARGDLGGMAMRNSRPAGFTLLELMIVVAVIGILAILAMPSFIEQIRKGKRAEAVRAIGDIQLRQERYRADNPSYATMDQLTGSAAATTAYNAALSTTTCRSRPVRHWLHHHRHPQERPRQRSRVRQLHHDPWPPEPRPRASPRRRELLLATVTDAVAQVTTR
jgi:prepilin-type N-terminal cleavage/methylation domain-containing protein